MLLAVVLPAMDLRPGSAHRRRHLGRHARPKARAAPTALDATDAAHFATAAATARPTLATATNALGATTAFATFTAFAAFAATPSASTRTVDAALAARTTVGTGAGLRHDGRVGAV